MVAPKVSVVLPVYNDANSVEEAITSVLKQSFDEYEIIVVDDGSTDGTAEVLKKYAERQQVTTIAHESNQGLPVALNTGIEAARGKLIARQDADDRSLPERLKRQYEYFDANPNVDLLATGVEVIDEEGRIRDVFDPPEQPAETFETANSIVHGSIMVRREVVEAVGGYDPFFKYCQDYDLWVRLAHAGYNIRGLGEPLYQLRRESTIPSVSDRAEYSLYGLIARTDNDTKERLKDTARNEGLHEVLSAAPADERANHYYRLSRANVDIACRNEALSAAISALKCAPLNRRSYQHLALSLAPLSVGQWLLSRVNGRR